MNAMKSVTVDYMLKDILTQYAIMRHCGLNYINIFNYLLLDQVNVIRQQHC